MNAYLSIHFDTKWGDQIYVYGNFHSPKKESKILLNYTSTGKWETTVKIQSNSTIRYKYILHTYDGVEISEPRYRNITTNNSSELLICDQWFSPDFIENILYRSLFENSIFNRDFNSNKEKNRLKKSLNFSINTPRVTKHQKVAVTGNITQLGNWDKFSPLILESNEYGLWSGGFDDITLNQSIEYKYAIYDTKKKCIVEWEDGENRILDRKTKKTQLVGDAVFRFSMPWKGSGMAIPIFSLRSKNGLGIGEFNDLKLFGDWISVLGMNVIQILPINDTISAFDWTDSYPYNAISIYALNPIYINIDALFKHDISALKELDKIKTTLNNLKVVDFEQVLAAKFEYLKKAYDYHSSSLIDDTEFKTFFTKNEFWLKAYSLFCYLRDRFKTTDFSKWENYAVYDEAYINDFFVPEHKHYDSVMFYVFVQYHLDKQLKSSVDYLHKKGIALKGDIPIGINRQSVDAWDSPHLFNLDQQTGAPPDYFSSVGQNWGFPTYNWKKMKKDGYKWWQHRFEKMADYFDAYRIDHILGFFRIWEIPFDFYEGLMGHFSPALPYTVEELRANGIPFDEKWWCTPHIKKHRAERLFKAHTEKILSYFFNDEKDIFYLKDEHFETKKLAEKCKSIGIDDEKVITALRDVICDVLFLRDSKTENLFHPRIEIQNTHKFNKLEPWVKHRLISLYNEFFFNRHNDFWKEMALQKLPALINTTNMLVCGEDLGMVPHNVPEVMNGLKILTLDIQTMPKDSGIEFADPRAFAYLSICTTSTHDTPTIRGMWKYDPDKGKRLIKSFSNESVSWYDDCPGWLCKKIIELNLNAGSILAILPFQDWLSIDDEIRHPEPHEERINKPEFSRHYWRYRMHISIEDLLLNDGLNTEIRTLIQNSKR